MPAASGHDTEPVASIALHTDHYELTMVAAALADGSAGRSSVFECFARRLPGDAEYGVVCGIDAALEAIAEFRFTAAELDGLRSRGVIDDATHRHLDGWWFDGDVDGLADGDLWFPGEPVLTVRAGFADAVVLETVVLSAIGPASSVATAAARLRTAAGDRSLIEMGSRRAHRAFAVEAARAAVVGGFDATSNLAAGARYGVPTAGTAAHAWTLVHPGDGGEQAAFQAQMETLGTGTTLLVDTFDTTQGIERAVAAAHVLGVDGPGAIRIDSGELHSTAEAARAQLDALGATETRIVVSGDLGVDELERLADAPIDGYGVGSHVVGAPSAGFVYKLAEVDGTGVAKASATPGKATIPGRKQVIRHHAHDEALLASELAVVGGAAAEPVAGVEHTTVVTRPLMRAGHLTSPTSPVEATQAAIDRCRRVRATFRPGLRLLSPPAFHEEDAP